MTTTTTMAAEASSSLNVCERHPGRVWCVFLCITAVLVVGIPVGAELLRAKPRYSVAIDSVSGLAPAAPDLRLNPEFSLTVRVASGSYRATACVDAGTYLEVSYRCVKLATSRTSRLPLCAGPRRSAEQRVVARGAGVRLPGHLLDSLTEDLRQGAQVFDVALKHSGSHGGGGDRWLASCDGGLVGWDADAALRSTCDTESSEHYYSCFFRPDPETFNSTQWIHDGRS